MSQAEAAPNTSGLATPGNRTERARRRVVAVRTMPYLIRACMVIVGLLVITAILAPILAPFDPAEQALRSRLAEPAGLTETGDHVLGADHLGRDILSRVIYGARVSLGIGLVGMVIGMTFGTALGLVSGFFRGFVDELVMFLVDVQLALPFIIIALAAIALFGTSLKVLILVVGFAGWEAYARLTRGMVLRARESQYVMAAEAIGAANPRMIVRHILPNIVAPIIVLATFQLTSIILLETTLSFLGIGVQPPTPSWGSMIGEGRDYLNTAWWIAVVPGVAIVLATMSVSLIGDWLRDVLDPTLRGR